MYHRDRLPCRAVPQQCTGGRRPAGSPSRATLCVACRTFFAGFFFGVGFFFVFLTMVSGSSSLSSLLSSFFGFFLVAIFFGGDAVALPFSLAMGSSSSLLSSFFGFLAGGLCMPTRRQDTRGSSWWLL